MDIIRERRLEAFVDRKAELRAFLEMLETEDRPIMSIWGRSGMGKSSLISRLVKECIRSDVRIVEIDCKRARYKSSYLEIMRSVKEELGVEHFQGFTDLVNHFFTVPDHKIQVNVGTTGGVDVNVQAAGERAVVAGVIIRDSNFVLPRQDITVPEEQRMARLTDRFLADLQPLAQKNLIVFFFDHVDDAMAETRHWIWGELLRAVLTGRLTHCRFVLCGQQPPPSDQEISDMWRAELKPLGFADVAEYLTKQKGLEYSENEFTLVAKWLVASTQGIPVNLVRAAQALGEMQTAG